MNNPLVSIVVPCYNQAHYLEEALFSVINQSYTNWECKIVNDGSTDHTEAIASKWIDKDSRFKYLEKTNGGLSSARNHGILDSQGAFILLLDSDDYFDTTFIEKAVAIIINDVKCGAVTCWGQRFSGTKKLGIFKPGGGDKKDFMFKNCAIGTSLIRKECWEKVGGYDETMKNGYEDWEFYIRLTQYWNVKVIPEVLFFYRQHKSSMLSEAIKSHDKEIKTYIFNKHKELYTSNYNATVEHFLNEINERKKNRVNVLKSLDYRLGHFILKPFRFIKKSISNERE